MLTMSPSETAAFQLSLTFYKQQRGLRKEAVVWFSVDILTLALLPEWKRSPAALFCSLSLAPSEADGRSSPVALMGQVS